MICHLSLLKALVFVCCGSHLSLFHSRAPLLLLFQVDVNKALDLASAKANGRQVNVAVNCAGIAIARRTLSKKGVHPLEDFLRVLTVNTGGWFHLSLVRAAVCIWWCWRVRECMHVSVSVYE
jgi:NAD(P)-dependent dehydrogenase (short-subunit alcohol dehydrogenase family)